MQVYIQNRTRIVKAAIAALYFSLPTQLRYLLPSFKKIPVTCNLNLYPDLVELFPGLLSNQKGGERKNYIPSSFICSLVGLSNCLQKIFQNMIYMTS